MKDAAAFAFVPPPSAAMPRFRWVRRAPPFDPSLSIPELVKARSVMLGCNNSIRHRQRRRPLSAAVAGQDPKSTPPPPPPTKPWGYQPNDPRFLEGERRFRQLLGTDRWQDVPAVFQELRRDDCALNLRTYRASMSVLAECGKGKEAMMYLQEMKGAGVIADNATLGYVATACARGGDLDSALTILRRMTEKGMSAPRTYNLVLLAIANGKTGTQPPPADRRWRRAGKARYRRGPLSPSECDRAVALVEEMRTVGASPTILTYNVLIAALARSRRPEEEVLGLLELMRGEGLLPDSYTYVGVIKALVGRDRCERGRELLEDAKSHLEGEALSAVYGAVISGCSPLARWEEATALIEEMRAASLPRDEYTYCAVLNVCKEAGRWEDAVNLLREMREDGVAPNLVAYNTAIGACAVSGRPSKPWSHGATSNSSSKWAKQRMLTSTQMEAVRIGDVALGLMDEMDEAGVGPDVITYGSLMSALSPRGKAGADLVLELFDGLLEKNIKPNTITYVSVIRAWGDKGAWQQAEKMLTEMSEVHGLESNRFCFSAVIKALAKGGQWKRALEKIDEMLALGLSPDPVVYTAAIGACERHGQWEEALDTLSKLIAQKPPKHALTWGYNAAVSALGKARQLDGARDLVATMKASGMKPDQYTYAALMRATGMAGLWQESLAMLDEMEAEGVTPNRVVYNTLVASLAKAEQFQEAADMLTRMRSSGVSPDVTTYTTMLSGCKRDADWMRAEGFVSEMQAFGIKPNTRTCTAMIKICGNAGEVERALALFHDWGVQGVEMDVYCFNAIMGAVLKNGLPDKVFELFDLLESRGLTPDPVTFSVALKAAEDTGRAAWASVLLQRVKALEGVPPVQVYVDAIRACCATERKGDHADVEGSIRRREMVGGDDDPGLAGDAGESRVDDGGGNGGAPLRRALDVFTEARQHFPGTEGRRLYTSAVVACARNGGVGGADAARKVIAEMRSFSVAPDQAFFRPAALAFVAGGDWEGAAKVIEDGAAMGLPPQEDTCELVRKAAQAKGQLGLAIQRLSGIELAPTPADEGAASPGADS